MRAVDNLLKIPSAWVFRVCSSKNSTEVSSLLEESQTYPVIIILITFFCLWLTHCSNGYRFHTTTGNKRYFKTRLFTRILVNSVETGTYFPDSIYLLLRCSLQKCSKQNCIYILTKNYVVLKCEAVFVFDCLKFFLKDPSLKKKIIKPEINKGF